MKSYCAMAALIATLAVSPLALGNDHADAAKAKPKTEAAAAPHVQFEAMQFGKVIEVGPDGKVEVKDFGGQLPKEVLDKLPQEVRDLLQKSSGKKSCAGARAGTSERHGDRKTQDRGRKGRKATGIRIRPHAAGLDG